MPLSKLQFNDQSFRTLLSAMPQIVFITDNNADLIYLNQKWYDYTGTKTGQNYSEIWTQAIHPDDLKNIYSAWEQAQVNHKPWIQEYRLKRFDGTYRWHIGRSVPDQDKDGAVRYWIGTATDIEDQKQAERALKEVNENLEQKVNLRTQELRQANAFLDTVIENIPNMIFVKDAENLNFVRFNKAGEDLIGVSRNDLIGKNDYDFFPPNEAAFFQEKDRAVMSGKVVVDIPEEPISTKNGIRTLHTKKLPVYDAEGNPRYLMGISEDITEKKIIEKERLQFIQEQIAKKESEKTAERFQFLSEASALLGSTLDENEILKTLTLLCVPGIADWCSVEFLQPDQSLKQIAVAHKNPEKIKWARALRQKYPPKPDAPVGPQNVVRTGRSELLANMNIDLLKTLVVNDEHFEIIKSVGFLSTISAPIRSRGKILGVLTLVTTEESQRVFTPSDLHLAEDIAERAGAAVENAQLYKEASQLNRVKDEFLATLSHELRTPLNVILGHAEILSTDTNISPKQLKQSMEAIYRNAKAQTGLIQDLLDVSSIITGKISYKPSLVNPVDIVSNIVDSLKTTAQAKDINLTLNTQDAPTQVSADPTRLHQIIWNLVSNAIKFTPQHGKVSVSIEMRTQHWEIIVTDNGRGIDPDFLPYVFDRFRQEDASTTRKYGGLGLGLSIVRHLTELHGGNVFAESRGKDQGSTFRVYLPLNVATTNLEEEDFKKTDLSLTPKAQKSIRLDEIKILLIEDSEDSRALIRLILDRAGAEIVEAASAKEAREKLKKFNPHIIVSDVGMAEESGIEFMQKLRTSSSKHKNIPSIALTAYVRAEEKEAVMKAGFQTHVGKPIQTENLLNEIKKLVQR